MTRHEARAHIQAEFKRIAGRDVSFYAHDKLLQEGNAHAAARCNEIHAALDERMWTAFAFDWTNVRLNPGGTQGRASVFYQVKAMFVYELAKSGAETSEAEGQLQGELRVFWLEWAGYTVTSHPDYGLALEQEA